MSQHQQIHFKLQVEIWQQSQEQIREELHAESHSLPLILRLFTGS